MFILYLSTISFILFTLYNCFPYTKNKKLVNKKLYDNKNYLFIIKNIEFFKDGKYIEFTNYNNYYFKQKKIELNVNFLYDFYIVNYIYDNIEYKYYSENSSLTFPIYTNEQIKNYVYINKITRATLLIKQFSKDTNKTQDTNNTKDTEDTEDTNNTEDTKNTEDIDILSFLIPFIGPNYNFYYDLEIKLNLDKILKYLKSINNEIFDKIDLTNNNYELQLYDNFNNKYNLDSNYLKWNPELIL
jgi:hypothetical protein